MMTHTSDSWTAWSSSSPRESKLDTLASQLRSDDSGNDRWQPASSAEHTGPVDEKTPLLSTSTTNPGPAYRSSFSLTSIPRRIAEAILGTFRLVISTVLAPGRWLIACFYDDRGNFSLAMPVYNVARKLSRRKTTRPSTSTAPMAATSVSPSSASGAGDEKLAYMASAIDTDSESSPPSSPIDDSPAHNTRSKATQNPAGDDLDAEPKKVPRVKIVNQDELRRRRQRRAAAPSPLSSSQEPLLTVATLKSPTSPASSAGSALKITKYPRTPGAPLPLVPRRQPSYSSFIPSPHPDQKTLVIDLDETLIHSMAKGGRMSTGHMVEVKLSSPIGVGGNVIGPQVPILYYVHKRPHCDEFLRKVSKWYNLIVFTASVQEYADPVIDWLELERKYFSARYYRQHCTYRNGAYIKDLSQVEPDLSRVMILDNSPMSYIFHEDNAIPIEGWISDPTDNDLLHLIPFFEGLQYATDVRALLALRLGEAIS